MPKPKYNPKEVVRVQRLHGGTIELRGKFAGDVVDTIEDACLVDLRQPGHHVLKVTGGEVQEVVQRQLQLEPKKTATKVAEQLIADIAPPEHEQELFSKMLTGKFVKAASYDADTGKYRLFLEPLKGKGRSYRVDMVTCHITEVLPGDDKKPTKTSDVGVDVVRSLHWCLRQTLNNMEGTFTSDENGCRVKMSTDRNIDRWHALIKKGATNQEIKTCLLDQFSWLIEVTYIEELEPTCAVMKRSGQPEFYWSFGKDNKPVVVLTGAKLVKAVRDIYDIPMPAKAKK